MTLTAEKLKIQLYPHPALRTRAKPIAQVTAEVREVARRMLQLMHDAPGVGLAAPQVGLKWRLFVACATGDPKDDQVFINPALSNPSVELEDYEEGCLSLPEIQGEIRRPKAITIQALDIEGNPVQLISDTLSARVWQHETDHLDGILIIDRMTPIDRMACQRKLRELETRDPR